MDSKKEAQKDFDLLKAEFKAVKGEDNSEKMYEKLLEYFDGVNDSVNESFDFDYKRLTATIVRNKGLIELSDDVDFYGDEADSPKGLIELSDDVDFYGDEADSPYKFFLQRVK